MRRAAVTVMLLVGSCGDPPATPGVIPRTYAYRAEGAVDCGRNTSQQCVCGEAGFHEGRLTLLESGGQLRGTLEARTCMPNEPCSAMQRHDVVAGTMLTSDSLYFKLNTTTTVRPHNGWFHFARVQGARMTGIYGRSDFSTNGCGDDQGAFTAVVDR